jgi:hypothetical protein
MGQMYLQRYAYRDGAGKAEIDQAWAEAFKTFAKSGNWGGVEAGVRHIQTYGTGWGGYVLIEVDDPEAFGRYQAHHNQTYGAAVVVTFEPLFDVDKTAEETIAALR